MPGNPLEIQQSPYFDAAEAQGLADSVKQWLELYGNGAHPRSDNMPWLTWKKSARRLQEMLIGKPQDNN